MKVEHILPFNWRGELENIEYYSINEDIILVENPIINSNFQYPFRMDVTLVFISIKGTAESSINMKPYNVKGPCLFTVLPGQIVEYKSTSEDFTGFFVIFSSKFTDSMMENAMERLPLFLSVRENPVIILDEARMKGIIAYVEVMKRLAKEKDNPYRFEVARYLTLAFFYGSSIDFYKISNDRKMTHQEVITEKLLNMVRIHYKKQRSLNFYANELSLSSKYLSRIIKETTYKPVNDWIDGFVVLEAKALLKSTNLTIQQISDELNFPSQSFFGKYFKRVTGMSPKEYKIKGDVR